MADYDEDWENRELEARLAELGTRLTCPVRG